jgi:N-acetylmuramoyl-L-alanine amidase-like protein
MTLRMPGVSYLGPPDSNWGGSVVRPPLGMVVHIAEGSYWGTIGWQQNPNSDVSSYFVVSRAGDIAQMLDLDLMAWTQANGNPFWIGVENEGFNTSPFTAAQVHANAMIFAWIIRVWPSIPYRVSNSPNTSGLGWHGMGGAAWGNHPNCPGTPNVALLPSIVQQAQAINTGTTPPSMEETMQFAREPNGSVWWVGIGFDPVSGRPYRRAVGDPNQWGRWQDAGFPSIQCQNPMNAADWVTLPPTGPLVSASATVSDSQVKAIADAAAAGAAAGAGNLRIELAGSAKPATP